jgi:hypothetical protein
MALSCLFMISTAFSLLVARNEKKWHNAEFFFGFHLAASQQRAVGQPVQG